MQSRLEKVNRSGDRKLSHCWTSWIKSRIRPIHPLGSLDMEGLADPLDTLIDGSFWGHFPARLRESDLSKLADTSHPVNLIIEDDPRIRMIVGDISSPEKERGPQKILSLLNP